MFGELGDSDIYENNRSGSFDDSSDATFSFDTQGDTGASVSDDFLDTFDSDDNFTPDTTAGSPASSQEQGGLLGGGARAGAYEQNVQQHNEMPETQQSAPAQKKSSPLLFILILVLLFAGAVGMFFYKKNMEQAPSADNQATGDYFYDKATEGSDSSGAASSAQAAVDGNVATVDVDLTTSAAKNDKNAQGSEKSENAENAKPMTAIEKALAKKKADAEKENRVGLHTVPSVVIPVSSGGRSDPFLPYGQQVASSVKPKFDLIAPPLDIPEEDPKVDTLLSFKITGIMYDNIRPSAILTVDGSEQLVHKGDVVMGYKILNITRNTVVVKYKTNVYEVSTGQSLNTTGVNLNPVSSISKQFGGAYTNAKNVIQFNK